MRARGAKVTDIVVLVVAADDGVMPQTVEAIHHAKAAKVPIIVAINKIDKPDAKPDRVRTELLQHEVQVESLGGDIARRRGVGDQEDSTSTSCSKRSCCRPKCSTSRPTRTGRPKAPSSRRSSTAAAARWPPCWCSAAPCMSATSSWPAPNGAACARCSPTTGRRCRRGRPVDAGRSARLQRHPGSRRWLAVVENEARAREVTDYRSRQKREKQAARGSRHARLARADVEPAQDLGPQGIPAGDQGRRPGLGRSHRRLAREARRPTRSRARIIHAGVGGITESDVTLAKASGAAIIGFNVRANKEARELAERDGVEIRYYNIIYDLVDDVKKAMSGLLAPTLRETMLGNALIREVFNITKVGKVAGCRVTDGTVERGANVRLIRDNVVIHEGKLGQLKRFKDDVKEVPRARNAACRSRTIRTCAPAT